MAITITTQKDTPELGAIPKTVYCLSTDTKPTDVPNGSLCFEMDTSGIYMFDAENGSWLQFVL